AWKGRVRGLRTSFSYDPNLGNGCQSCSGNIRLAAFYRVGNGDMRRIRRAMADIEPQAVLVLRVSPGVCSAVPRLWARLESSCKGEMVATEMVEAGQAELIRVLFAGSLWRCWCRSRVVGARLRTLVGFDAVELAMVAGGVLLITLTALLL